MAVAVNLADSKPRWISGTELAAMASAPKQHLIQNLLPAKGAALLAADAKCGKSTLALELGRAVCTGTPALEHFATCQGAVLYWMADDGSKDRFVRNYQEVFDREGLPSFHAGVFRLPLAEGGEDELIGAIYRFQPKLVIIDCLTAIRGAQTEKDFVKAEYELLRSLADIGNAHECLLLVLHHKATGKRGAQDNPFRLTAGSYSITAAVDAMITLSAFSMTRPERIVTLAGRDLDSQTFIYARDVKRRLFYIGDEDWARDWEEALRVYRASPFGTITGELVGEALNVSDRAGRAKLAGWRMTGIAEDAGGKRHIWSARFIAAAQRLAGSASGSGGER